jgi:hypothetical protein
MVASNQVRENQDAGKYGVKYKSTGGFAIGFYASLRLRASNPEKIKIKEKIAGKEVTRVVGVRTEFEVFKSSIWKPYRTAPVTILFDYGIDDVRENLQFIKDFTKNGRLTQKQVNKISDQICTILAEFGKTTPEDTAKLNAAIKIFNEKFNTTSKQDFAPLSKLERDIASLDLNMVKEV